MSKSLVKILDYSIFPASILILAKFVGILLVSNVFNIYWSFKDSANSVFALSTVLNQQDAITITAYSDLFMYTVIAFFFSIAVFRAIFLHNTHPSEMVILSLAKLNLLNVVKDSYTVYAMAGGWWLFMVLSNVIIWSNILAERSLLLVGVLTSISTIFLTLLLILDVYREITLIRKHPAKYIWH